MMTPVEILDSVLSGVDFTHPVELADVKYVHDAIVAQLPQGTCLESFHRYVEVYFELRTAGRLIARRTKKVL